MKSSSFRFSFIISTELSETNLNGVFVNNTVKYDVDQEIMITYENL